MNDRAYGRKEDQARGQGDLKHAYDGVQPWAIELVLQRMGVPVEYVAHQAELVRRTRTAVITPFGVTDRFKRASGLPQGGTHSCALWNAFIDLMAEMQEGMIMTRQQGVCCSSHTKSMARWQPLSCHHQLHAHKQRTT